MPDGFKCLTCGDANCTGLHIDAPKPRRRVVLKLDLGADDREAAIRELENIAREMRRGHMWGNSCVGGYSVGYSMEISEDKTITHDSYFESIKDL